MTETFVASCREQSETAVRIVAIFQKAPPISLSTDLLPALTNAPMCRLIGSNLLLDVQLQTSIAVHVGKVGTANCKGVLSIIASLFLLQPFIVFGHDLLFYYLRRDLAWGFLRTSK